MRISILFLICFLAPLFSYANWVTDQIREDLSPFEAEGISRTAICDLAQQLPWDHQLVLIKIRKDRVSFSLCIEESKIHPWTKARLDVVKQFFKKLIRRYRLPDIDFLLSLHDSFEEDFNLPIFSFAKNRAATHTTLFPDFEALSDPNALIHHCDQASTSHPWHLKQDKIFWRGTTTGGIYQIYNYLDFPRVKLVFLSSKNPLWLDAAFTSYCQSSQDMLNLIAAQSRPLEPYVCMEDHFSYKYLIDIDGNSCTYSRCRWILLSNSTLLKPDSPNIQWYYKAMQPWTHYVPLRADLSDLPDAYAWLQSHEAQAQQIALSGQHLGHLVFSEEAIEDYAVTLLCAYGTLQKK
jgi:hypothetical protein